MGSQGEGLRPTVAIKEPAEVAAHVGFVFNDEQEEF